jgi:hypothetical protein
MTQTLEHVVSQDGTAIAFRRVGTGPPVVVMRGALGTSLSWLAVAERLADRFEFLLVDRRGPRLLPGIASVCGRRRRCSQVVPSGHLALDVQLQSPALDEPRASRREALGRSRRSASPDLSPGFSSVRPHEVGRVSRFCRSSASDGWWTRVQVPAPAPCAIAAADAA